MRLWRQLGGILADRGILSPKTIDRVISLSFQQNSRFPMLLEDLGLVTSEELTDALATQFGLERVTGLKDRHCPAELIDLIPTEYATLNHLFPLEIIGNTLRLAMADPTNRKLLSTLARDGMYSIVPLVAARKDIHAAICRNYLEVEIEETTPRTILIVDDDLFMRTILSDMVRKAGYEAVTAADGVEAFKIITGRKPHVIISDKVMPNFDGFDFSVSLRQMIDTRYIPIILISGQMSLEDEDEAFDLGFFAYIPKPINEATLLATISQAFHAHSRKYRFF